jgi:hypothetical protein
VKPPTLLIPEFWVPREVRRAGFIPADDDKEHEIELWQLWCRSSDGEDARRATLEDLAHAGFVLRSEKRKRVRKGKAANKSTRRK